MVNISLIQFSVDWQGCVPSLLFDLRPNYDGGNEENGKEQIKAEYCHPAYLIYMQSTSCEMMVWMKHKLASRLSGETSITSEMQMTPPYGRKRRGTKESFDDVKEESEKSGLKLNIQKTKIMASGPI